MQVKFAIRTTSNKTGPIKSISKYEMLYISQSIPAKRIYLDSHVQLVNDVSNFNGKQLYCDENDDDDDGPALNNHRIRLDSGHIYRRVSQILVTLIVCLWWIGSIGVVYCGNSVSDVLHFNESITSQRIKWPPSATSNLLMKTMVTTSLPMLPLSVTSTRPPSIPIKPKHQPDAIKSTSMHESLSSMVTLNVLNGGKRSEQRVNEHVVRDAHGSYKRHQRQQFGISIITRSKKTNPNASFSLDLIKHSGNVQSQNTTLNSLAHESNRIPDAIRESLHHHHSVIKRFRAFVTKRYHFLAGTKTNSSNFARAEITTPDAAASAAPAAAVAAAATAIVAPKNDGPIEPPLKHLIYVLTTIDQPSNSVIERVQRYRKTSPDRTTNANNHMFNVINRTKVLLRDVHQTHFNVNGPNHKNGTPSTVHSNKKRSINQQKQSQPTKTPFDDHFLNSKLQNYYFLYQIDNISNYNNHFDLLNSPNNYNATQIQINQQRIQFSKRQIDNALIDTTESDFLQYNPNKLHFNNKHTNHIKRHILAKIASICLNCIDGTDPPVKIHMLTRSMPVTEPPTNREHHRQSREISANTVGHGENGTEHFIQTNRIDNKHLFEWQTNDKNRIKRILFPFDSSLTNSLKNYPRIADLLGNLSLGTIPEQATIQLNYRNENERPNESLANNLHVIIDKYDDNLNNSSHQLATALYTLIDANATATATQLSAAHSFYAILKSLKTSNSTTSDHIKDMPIPTNATIAIDDDTITATAATNISNYNYSPISTFEHYIRIISSRNINNRNNYYAIQTTMDANKMKTFNFQQHLMQKFKRIKKQQQIIKLFTTNHRFTHNNMNDNNINGTDYAAGQATDTNIVNNFKLNFTLNERNCTWNELNESKRNSVNNVRPNVQTAQIQRNDKAMQATVLTSIKHNSNVKQMTESIRLTNSRKVKRNEKITSIQHQSKHNEKSRPSNALNSYLMRLESIKYQILIKLGLKQKPNITNTLPKHVIMETLYRAEDTNVPQSSDTLRKHPHRKQHRPKQRHKQKHQPKHSKTTNQKQTPSILLNDDPNQQVYHIESHQFSDKNSSSAEEKFGFNADMFDDVESNDVESDDFYGRTREIIIFAEKGSYFNHQPLIEFVSTNGLDESVTSNSVNSNSDASIAMPLNRTVPINDTKLKQRPKCKGDIIENRQVRKRKRRRRRHVFESMDVRKIVRGKPGIVVSNEKQILEETLVKTTTTAEQSHYQTSDSDNYSDTRVRRAFLWIKVDETIKKKKGKDMPKASTKHHKFKANRHRSISRNFFRLWVFRIVEPNSEPNQHIKLSASKSVHVSRLGWQKLDVTSTVRQWYASGGKSRLRFLVDCSGCVDRFKIHLFDSKPTKNSNARAKPNLLQNDKLNGTTDPVRPFLVIYTDPHVIKRVRRHTPDCSVAVRGQCCKQKFYVSFAELGWDDWIIAPHGYYANYCQGNCNGLRTPDSFRSYHSHVIEEYRKMNRLTGLQPCCTPLKFSSMSLIYYEENQKIIKRDLPKMVVDECGCP